MAGFHNAAVLRRTCSLCLLLALIPSTHLLVGGHVSVYSLFLGFIARLHCLGRPGPGVPHHAAVLRPARPPQKLCHDVYMTDFNFSGNSLCANKKKIAMPCELLKKFSGFQRHCSNFFVPSMPLPSVWALTPSNCRCEKSKIPLSVNMSLIFFEHLNDFK